MGLAATASGYEAWLQSARVHTFTVMCVGIKPEASHRIKEHKQTTSMDGRDGCFLDTRNINRIISEISERPRNKNINLETGSSFVEVISQAGLHAALSPEGTDNLPKMHEDVDLAARWATY